MSENTSASGGLPIDMSKLFDTAVNCVNMGRDLGVAWGNAIGGNNNQPFDPNTRLTNQNPYAQNPYANQATPYQPASYGYEYGNIGNTQYATYDYQLNGYPGITNPNYGM